MPLDCTFSIPPLLYLVSQEGPPQPPLQIGSCSGCLELTVKLKQNEAFPGPKVGPQTSGDKELYPISASF